MAKQMKGYRESYLLSANNGATQLFIECDMAGEYFEMMSAAWDKALQQMKVLAEAN